MWLYGTDRQREREARKSMGDAAYEAFTAYFECSLDAEYCDCVDALIDSMPKNFCK